MQRCYAYHKSIIHCNTFVVKLLQYSVAETLYLRKVAKDQSVMSTGKEINHEHIGIYVKYWQSFEDVRGIHFLCKIREERVSRGGRLF